MTSLVLLIVLVGCATAPPPPPPVTFEQKMSWILRLEDQRVLREPAPPEPVEPAVQSRGARALPASPVPDLTALVADSEARVRRRAALAIGRVGLPEGVPALLPLLAADPEPEVRRMAAFALGLIGASEAAEPLIAALEDPSPIVQGRAAQALGLVGAEDAGAPIGRMVARHATAAAAVAPGDLAYPQPPEVEAFRLGVYALAALGQYEPLAEAVIAPDGQPRVRWWPVAFALQRLQDRRAAEALTTFARSDEVHGAVFGARGLGELKDPSAAETLLPLVNPARDPKLLIAAVRALALLGARETGPVLLKLLYDRELEPNVALEVAAALGTLGVADALDAMLDLLTHPWPAMRAAAIRALSRIDPETFVLVLSSRDPDRHWSVRAALAEALASLDAEIAVPRLTAMLDDEDQRVVPAVLASLAALDAPGIDQILLDRLTAPDFVVRMRAARLIGERQPAGGPPALEAAYELALADTTYVARAAALDALAEYGGEVVLGTLRRALADKDWAVRVRAASLLDRLEPGDYAEAIRPAPTRLSAEAYEAPALVGPTVSPHVYIETAKGLIEIELLVLDAPLTTQIFMSLARDGFFNGFSIHRVVPNFVVQDGDPRGDGEGGPGFTLRDELSGQPYLRGTVGLALDWEDTGGSQFFITHSPQPQLDARYPVFGHVVNGLDVVDRLQQWDRIERVTVWDGESFDSR